MKKKLLFTLLFAAQVAALVAAPAKRVSTSGRLADGREVEVFPAGDEWTHHYTDQAGRRYDLLPDGTLCPVADTTYTRRMAAGNMRRQNMAARHSGVETRAAYSTGYPTTGSPKTLVILVNFSDRRFTRANPKDHFERMLNERGFSDDGATGSALDYYSVCSQGRFTPQFVVVGPYDLPNSMAYYGANSDGHDSKPAEMVVDACKLANKDVNFAEYDLDSNGYIDNVYIYYAGYNEAEGGPANSIWPHRWVIYPTAVFSGGNYNGSVSDITFDGKMVADYACSSELKGNTGSTLASIGTFCHEFGHVLGLPDYYHTTNSRKPTLGAWDIMDYGCYSNESRTPPVYGAYSRFFLGWCDPEELYQPESVGIAPPSQEEKSNVYADCYLLSEKRHNRIGTDPSPAEFFLVEYRQQTGWDTYLPESGLCIWHIDYKRSAWTSNTPNNYSGTYMTSRDHMRIYLENNDGLRRTPTGNAFQTGQSFSPCLWNSTYINRPVSNIRLEDGMAYFDIMGGSPFDLTPPTADSSVQVTPVSFRACWTDRRSAEARRGTTAEYELDVFQLDEQDTTYVLHGFRTSQTNHTVTGLQNNVEYCWRVRTVVYGERSTAVTRTSPKQIVTTGQLNGRSLPIDISLVDGRRALQIIAPVLGEDIFIHSADGRLVGTIRADEPIIYLPLDRLQGGTLYILHQGRYSAKFAK